MRDCLIKEWIPAEYYPEENGIKKVKTIGKYSDDFTKPAKFHKWVNGQGEYGEFYAAIVEYEDGIVDIIDYTKIKFKPI